ncbi:MAG: hypothetical protein AAFR38_05385 [Planctomycetota bacterium]
MRETRNQNRKVFYPPTGTVKVAWYAGGYGYGAAEWSEALARVDWRGDGPNEAAKAWVLKAGRKGTVWRATLPVGRGKRERALECVLKVEPLRGIGKRFQALLRKTKAWRQRDGARLLEKKKIPCSPCHAILRGKGRSGFVEVLVARWIEGPTLLERLAADDRTIAEEQAISAALADLTANLLDGRPALANLDHKPSNMILSPGRPVALIDSVAIEKVGRVDHGEAEEMFECMVRECGACAHLPSRSSAMRFARALASRRADGKRTDRRQIFVWLTREAAREDWQTPRDDPLAPPRRAYEIEAESGAPARAAPKE